MTFPIVVYGISRPTNIDGHVWVAVASTTLLVATFFFVGHPEKRHISKRKQLWVVLHGLGESGGVASTLFGYVVAIHVKSFLVLIQLAQSSRPVCQWLS